MVEKRTIKISVAVMAIAALVMGLAIGLGQKNKNDKTSSASSLQAYQRNCDAGTFEGPGSAKSGKGPTAPSEGKAGKALEGRRELIVPGTEDAAVSLGSGKRRMMKEELLRGKLCFDLFFFLLFLDLIELLLFCHGNPFFSHTIHFGFFSVFCLFCKHL